jgi:hypothetical protein
MDWIDLAQDREASCEHGNEPSGSINVGKFLSSCATGGFSRRTQLHGVSCFLPSQHISCSHYSK